MVQHDNLSEEALNLSSYSTTRKRYFYLRWDLSKAGNLLSSSARLLQQVIRVRTAVSPYLVEQPRRSFLLWFVLSIWHFRINWDNKIVSMSGCAFTFLGSMQYKHTSLKRSLKADISTAKPARIQLILLLTWKISCRIFRCSLLLRS